MEDVYFWLSFYTLGVLINFVLIVADIMSMSIPMVIDRRGILLLSLLSWVLIFSRFAAWLMDFVTYWYVWIVFKYKVWINNRKKE